MLSWEKHKSEIVERVAATEKPFKILLKIKDDFIFLDRWVSHHANIVGRDGLIIFDNGSTAPEMVDFYKKNDDIAVYSYEGLPDNIHYVAIFQELYDALQASAPFFTFIDSDEFLICSDGSSYAKSSTILDRLAARPSDAAIPTTWVHNAIWSDAVFNCGRTPDGLRGGLMWGKPILGRAAHLEGAILHNAQIPSAYYAPDAPPEFFLLHMTKLFPDRRIAANMRKLRHRGFAAPSDAVEDVLKKSLDGVVDSAIPMFVDQIRSLQEEMRRVPQERAGIASGQMRLNGDGTIEFSDDQTRASFSHFAADRSLIETVFKSG